MVDTITLVLNIRGPRKPIFDKKRAHEWLPGIGHIIDGGRSSLYGRGCISHYRPPSNSEKTSGEYYPEVKLLEHVQRGSSVQQELYITFSAPKLIFGNNFNELTNKYLCLVCIRLSIQLQKMGITVSPNTLRKATVSEIHCSKNILLKNRPIDEVFAVLRRMWKPMRKNWRYERYAGGGQLVNIYTQRHSTCLYDKRAESRRRKARFGSAYSDAYEQPHNISVLRMEVRCTKTADIKRTLQRSGVAIPAAFTLENLFDSKIARAVLLTEFDELRAYIPPITLTGSLSDIVSSIATLNPGLKINQLVNAATIIKLTNELGSEEAVRSALKISSPTWSRRKKWLATLKLPTPKTPDFLDEVKRQLDKFVPVRVIKKTPP